MHIKGFPWCQSDYKTISLANAKANILCKHHNELLSPTDAEAQRFQKALMRCSAPDDVRKGRGFWRGPQIIRLSGILFSRWLTKTYCNTMTVAKRVLSEDFISYSFGSTTQQSLSFYIYVHRGQRFAIQDNHIQFRDFYNDQGDVMFYVRFFGFHWFAANCDLRNTGTIEIMGLNPTMKTAHLMEKPKALVVQQDLGGGLPAVKLNVQIDWSALD